MKNIIILFVMCVILACLACSTTSNELVKDKIAITETEINYIFPEEWIGNYSGTLNIYSTKGNLKNVDMELIIGEKESNGNYPWILKYGDQDLRAYAIRKDTSTGVYLMDELNGIVIESYVLGPKFISNFSVMNNEIMTITEKKRDHLIFEIISTSTDTVSNSYAIEGDQRFDVATFPVKIYQKAVLTNKKTLSK